MSQKCHEFSCRVYYEDTDLAGVVYYANYLKFIERARSEWIRKLGINQKKMMVEQKKVFTVRRVEADYLSSAKFDDTLLIKTKIEKLTSARVVLSQDIFVKGVIIFKAIVTITCVNLFKGISRIPVNIFQIMLEYKKTNIFIDE